ncbi:MAG: LacI family DNA-binding transcriptional regulator [Candidatus Caldatribacteriaceae bacterium]
MVSSSFFFPGFLTGVAEACEDFSYQLLVTTSFRDCDTDFHYERLLKTRSVDGLIVSDIFYNDLRFAVLKKSSVPFVSIGKPEGGDIEGIHWVDHDQETMAEKAVDYLIQLGHRNIVFIGLSLKRMYTLQRLQGYQKSLQKASIPFREELILCEEMWYEEAEEKIMTFLQNLSSFTAVFTIGGNLTLNSLRALDKLAFRIPRDVSLLGNIEVERAEFLGIRLSGIRVYPRILGYITAKTLVELIKGKEKEIGQFLEAEFVEGESIKNAATVRENFLKGGEE